MPSRWPLEALKAQAVAARTYAWYSMRSGRVRRLRHLRDRGVPGVPRRRPGARRGDGGALAAGRRRDRRRGAAARRRADPRALLLHLRRPDLRQRGRLPGFRSPRPYLVPIDDPDDAVSPYHRWTARFTRAEWDDILGRGDTLSAAVPVAAVERVGTVDDPGATIRVTGQDGTVVEVSARDLASSSPGSRRNATPTGSRERRTTACGACRHRALEPVRRRGHADEVVLHGQGWGHGVGLGQYGARGRAERGESYEDILAAYYAGLAPIVDPDLPTADPGRLRGGRRGDRDADHPVRGSSPAARSWSSGPSAGGPSAARPTGSGCSRPRPTPRRWRSPPTRTAEGPAPRRRRGRGGGAGQQAALLRLEVTDPAGTPVVRRELGVAEPGRSTRRPGASATTTASPSPRGSTASRSSPRTRAGSTGGAPVGRGDRGRGGARRAGRRRRRRRGPRRRHRCRRRACRPWPGPPRGC
jgi:hypothetical protein